MAATLQSHEAWTVSNTAVGWISEDGNKHELVIFTCWPDLLKEKIASFGYMNVWNE